MNTVRLLYVPSEQNLSDSLTKSVEVSDQSKHYKLIETTF